MSDNNDSTLDGVEGNGLDSDESTATNTDSSSPDLAAEMRLWRKELADFRREQRKFYQTAGTAQPAQKPSAKKPEPTQASEYAQLQARLDFRDALEESGLTLNAKQRKTLERLFMAEKPQDLGAWIAEQADVFGVSNQPVKAAASTQDTPRLPKLSAEAPAGNGLSSKSLPDDPTQLTIDAVDRMTPEQAAEYWKNNVSSAARKNPFRAAMERRKNK